MVPSAMGVRVYGFLAVPLAAICYLIVCTPIAGEPQTSPTGLGTGTGQNGVLR